MRYVLACYICSHTNYRRRELQLRPTLLPETSKISSALITRMSKLSSSIAIDKFPGRGRAPSPAQKTARLSMPASYGVVAVASHITWELLCE